MRLWNLLLLAAIALPAQPVVVVLELFTSEGCSSCPPADALLAQLDGRDALPGYEVITLGEHVDYWDSLGWRDSYSSPLFSARQSEYGQIFKQEGVYTPQVVVNGQAECLGSDRAAILTAVKAIAKASRAPAQIKRMSSDRVTVRVGKLPDGANEADILLAIAEDGLASNVDRGENRGRQLKHVAVVRSLTRLGRLDPKKDAGYTSEVGLNNHPSWNPANLKFVLLVQDRTTKRILAAASAR